MKNRHFKTLYFLKKMIAVGLVGIMAVGLLVGCGSDTDGSSATEDDSATEDGSATEDDSATEDGSVTEKIVVATSGGPSPYIYTDDSGELTGYDIEVITEIFNRLPQYEMEIQTVEFASIFTGMDAGYYQVACNHLGYNEERAAKYIYTDVYTDDPQVLVVRDDETDIETVYDLGGHVTNVTAASFYLEAFESYNESHTDNPIILNYVETTDNAISNIVDGVIDFELFSKFTVESQIEASGLADQVKVYDVPNEDLLYISGEDSIRGNFFLVPVGYEQLADDINEALESMIEDGTIHELRKKYTGVTDENDEFTLDTVYETREKIENAQ